MSAMACVHETGSLAGQAWAVCFVPKRPRGLEVWFVIVADPGTVYLLGIKAGTPARFEAHRDASRRCGSMVHRTSYKHARRKRHACECECGLGASPSDLDKLKKRKREVDRYLLRVNHPHDRVLAIQASSSRRNPFQWTGTQGVSGDGRGTYKSQTERGSSSPNRECQLCILQLRFKEWQR